MLINYFSSFMRCLFGLFCRKCLSFSYWFIRLPHILRIITFSYICCKFLSMSSNFVGGVLGGPTFSERNTHMSYVGLLWLVCDSLRGLQQLTSLRKQIWQCLVKETLGNKKDSIEFQWASVLISWITYYTT